MKLNELFESEKKQGTYIGVRLDEKSKNMLYDFAKEHNIQNRLKKDDYHITVIYSRKHLPKLSPKGELDPPIVAKPKEFNVFDSRDNKRCLVLELKCPELVNRHEEIMDEHKAEYDWDEYKCHITLSYDIGDMDIKDLPLSDVSNININEEYIEDLQLDWLVNKDKKN